MRRGLLPLLMLSALGVAAMAAEPQAPEATGTSLYEPAPHWPQMAKAYPHAGYIMGSSSGIFAESPDRIFVLIRGEVKLPAKLPAKFDGFAGSLAPPGIGNYVGIKEADATHDCIMVVDANGKLIEAWTQWDHLFEGGRGPAIIRISPFDPARHVWVVDDYLHEVFEFTNDGGTLVRTLGERAVSGVDESHFRQPTDIAFLSDGSILVADGSGNSRVVKFDKDGRFLKAWGKPGKGPSEFNTIKGVVVGPDHHVYVADRGNSRIQVFDENGTYITEWPKIRAQTMLISADGMLWLYDLGARQYREYDLTGRLISSSTVVAGPADTAHQIGTDTAGNVYAAGESDGHPKKFQPKPGADPAKLMRAVALMGKEISSAPGSTNFEGTWKLNKSDPQFTEAADVFGAVGPSLTIKQTATDLTLTEGKTKLVFKLDGSETANPAYVDHDTGSVTKTTVKWMADKLMLYVHQGLNHDRDTLSLENGVLNIKRDVIMLGGASHVVALTYDKQ